MSRSAAADQTNTGALEGTHSSRLFVARDPQGLRANLQDFCACDVVAGWLLLPGHCNGLFHPKRQDGVGSDNDILVRH
jgi:hypothetical protein